jgi:hypothetical protein
MPRSQAACQKGEINEKNASVDGQHRCYFVSHHRWVIRLDIFECGPGTSQHMDF